MASRFWVGGTGTWDSSTTTHWAATTGGTGGQSVPGSADTVTFDGSSGGGTVTLNFGGTITIQSITWGAFTGTIDNSVNNNNMTLSANTAAFSGTGSGTRTFKAGTATYSLTSTGNGTTPLNMTTTTGLTFTAGSSTFDFSGVISAGTGATLQTGGLTFGTVKVSGLRLNSGLIVAGGGTIGTLNIAAAATVSLSATMTITTLTMSAQMTLIVTTATTLTITNALTLGGTASAPFAVLNSSATITATAATVSCASGTFSGTYGKFFGITFSGGATFSFTNSDDLGHNSGATITAPIIVLRSRIQSEF